jgi:nuclear pore complex protein Nup98-Nup96
LILYLFYLCLFSSEITAADTISTVKMGKIRVFSKENESIETKRLIELLQVQLKHSIVEEDEDDFSDCPAIFPMSTLRFHHFVTALEGLQDSHYEVANFKLGAALFDEVDTKLDHSIDHPHDFVNEVMSLRRRNNVANWIRWYEADTVRNEIRSQLASTGKNTGEQAIFSYLSAGFFEEACKQAIEVGDVRLATLLAQASSGGDEEEFRLDLLDQLSVWRSSGVDTLISTEYRRIVELLSGNVTWSKGNGKRDEGEVVKDLQIASGLDWIRTFALFLHFDSRFDSSLTETLERYEGSIGGDADIVPPLPPYLDKEIRPGSQRFRSALKSGVYPRDVLFHLLKLFCNPTYELENVLQPLNSSPNRLSYSLAFHTGLILSKVLGNRDFSDRIDMGIDNYDLAQEANLKGNSGKSDRLCIDFAMQLETLGLWKWSAFVLLHLELRQSRIENIQALLARNVDSLSLGSDGKDEQSPDVSFLVETLKIPVYWLYEAKADRACSSEDRWQEYQYSLLAQNLSRAHEIAIRYLAPEGIIRQDFDFILHLFVPFQQGAGKLGDDDAMQGQDVAGWSRGGQIYVDYIAICRSLPWLLSNFSKSAVPATKSGASLSERDQDGLLMKIEQLAEKIPKLIKDVRELFDGFQQSTSMLVAQTQMITSLYTCIRLLKSSPHVKHLDLVNLEEDNFQQPQVNTRPIAVEVENLQFFANDYCSLLIGIDASA